MQSPAPSEYFPNIKFNYSFYTSKDSSVTLEYVNNNFLKCTGYAYSRAISTTFNGIIYALGGIETTNITVTGTITVNLFSGNGASLTTLNASNVTDGTLPVARGGTGSNTLASGQLLIGNGLKPLSQSSNLSWSSNTLSTANITTSLLNSTDLITTNLNTTFMSGFKNTFYPLAFQNICSSTNLTKSVGADTDTVKTVYTTFGTHTLTVTSVGATSSKIENIFDNNSSTYWITSAATYTRLTVDANYTANSSFSMNVTNLGVVYGQSIKVRLPHRICLKDVLYIPFSLPTSITNGYILGSTNDSTWEPVYPITNFLTNLNEVSLVPTSILPPIYNGSSKSYQYFMIIATTIQGTTGAPINSTEKFAITNLQFTLYDNWVYHDNIISIGNFPNGYPVSNALDVNGNTYISGKILTDGGLNVLNGNIGIGLTNPNVSYKLDVSGNINTLSYTVNGNQFNSSQWSTNIVDATKIYYNGGNVGIGTTNPQQILQVGGGGRLRIANNNTDYSIMGVEDTDGTTNTRIVVSGINRTGNNGNIDYISTSSGSHIFYTTSSTTERMRITIAGNVGIGNTAQLGLLHLGDVSKANNDGHIIFAKCTTVGSTRICRVGYNNNFEFVIGDIGGGNALSTWSEQFKINYQAPNGSFYINSGGHTTTSYNLNVGSDLAVGGTSYHRNTYIYSGGEWSSIGLYFATPFTGSPSSSTKSAIIEESQGTYSRHNLAFCLNTSAGNSANVSTADVYMRFNYGNYIDVYKQFRVFNEMYGGFVSVTNTDTDYLCIQGNYGGNGSYGERWIRVVFGSFTTFHRCYTDDELYNNDTQENIDLFKNNYMGRVVIATGKIKSDFTRTTEAPKDPDGTDDKAPKEINEWYSEIDIKME